MEYPKHVLPSEKKWGPEMWDENYRDNNRINCYDTGTSVKEIEEKKAELKSVTDEMNNLLSSNEEFSKLTVGQRMQLRSNGIRSQPRPHPGAGPL